MDVLSLLMSASLIPQVVLPAALFLIMTGVGLSLTLSDFRRITDYPRAVLVGVLLQLIALPVLAFLLVTLFGLSGALAAGLMMVALAPGGATSNLITYLLRGDTALSVSLTALSSLITPFTMPVMAWMVLAFWLPESGAGDFPIVPTMLKLLVMALVPVALGMLVRHFAPAFSERMQAPVKFLSILFLVAVVVGIVKANHEQLMAIIGEVAPVALLLMVLAMLMGWAASRLLRLSPEIAITLAIETGIQNAGTALLITAGILQNPQMSAAALSYGVLMNVPVLLLLVWRNLPQQKVAQA